MRISSQFQNQLLAGSIAQSQSEVYRLQKQVSSGKAIESASDDPTAWSKVSRLNHVQAELERYGDNSELLNSRLTAMDASLSTIGDILQSASELAVQGAQGTLSDDDISVLAEQADQYLEELVSQANQKYDDQYLFGGTASGSEPFVMTRNAEGRIESVTYAGSEDVSEIEVADGDRMGLQMVGGGEAGVFVSSGADAFAALIEMRDQLLNGENLADSGVQDLVDKSYDQVLIGRAVVGAQMERVEFVSALRDAQDSYISDELSEIEDVDVAEVVAELTAKNVAYEAVLALTSKSMNMSLLNYI